MFGVSPTKLKPGYANFEISDPPLKLVLFESTKSEAGTINHLGVEVTEVAEVSQAESRLTFRGLDTTGVKKHSVAMQKRLKHGLRDPMISSGNGMLNRATPSNLQT